MFRWLFGSHKHNETTHNLSNSSIRSADRDYADDLDTHISFGKRYDNSYSRYENHDHGYSQSYDDFLDEQDDYDIMDDDF